MPYHVISYDLRAQRDYESLYEAIKSYGAWAHILESTWAVASSKSTTEVRDHLVEFIDSDDGLFVVQSGGPAAWRNVLCKSDWLQDNLSWSK